MKRSIALSLVASGAVFCLMGCNKESAVDATKPLAQSFESAQPEVKKSVETVNVGLKAGNYLEAARALEPILDRRDLTPPQRQAIGVALSQMNKAVAANPSLDSKELYELRAKMFKTMRSGSSL